MAVCVIYICNVLLYIATLLQGNFIELVDSMVYSYVYMATAMMHACTYIHLLLHSFARYFENVRRCYQN